MAFVPGLVRVVCRHGTVTTFIAHEGSWTARVLEAERVDDDNGERYRFPVRCDSCRLTVPIRKMELLGPILDRLVRVDNPAVKQVSPAVVEVSLKLLANAVGASRTLPE